MKNHRRIRILAALLALAVVLAFVPDLLVLRSGGAVLDRDIAQTMDQEEGTAAEGAAYTVQAPAEPADCILVLGAGVYADGAPTPMLKDRLDRGIALYRLGFAGKILLTGDNGQVEYNEVEAMKNYVLAAGIPEEDVFLDHAGFSTYESMFRAQAVFNVKSAVVVTQRYHEYRALYIGKRLGLTVTGVAARDVQYRGDAAREIREILARDKDYVKCIFRPDPTFLGDVIDIHGDGHVSW